MQKRLKPTDLINKKEIQKSANKSKYEYKFVPFSLFNSRETKIISVVKTSQIKANVGRGIFLFCMIVKMLSKLILERYKITTQSARAIKIIILIREDALNFTNKKPDSKIIKNVIIISKIKNNILLLSLKKIETLFLNEFFNG